MLADLPAWRDLRQHYEAIKQQHLRELFATQQDRFAAFSMEACGLLLDYSRNRITAETLTRLVALADECDLPARRDALFGGQTVNHSEGRAALHTALRDRSAAPIWLGGRDVSQDVRGVLAQLRDFASAVMRGKHCGHSGKPFTHVVNIGIGGSCLGAALVCDALQPATDTGLAVRFIAEVDSKAISDGLHGLDAASTLFIISSKTFTTQETITNAQTARRWVNQALGDESAWQAHFVAVTAEPDKALAFGIKPAHIFPLWEWVGGRYSLWSAMGLPIVLAAGMQQFEQLLQGAYEMDCHFREAPPQQNMPIIMALLGIWYRNFFAADTQAILPYDQHLARLPAYLQQLEMESNGKQCTQHGEVVNYPTAAVLWGQTGNSGQHAFFQLLHQGTQLVPTDFIAPMRSPCDSGEHHKRLLSHCFAQSEALAQGKTATEAKAELAAQGMDKAQIEALLPHKVFAGNRPSNTIAFPQLDAKILGSLLACYEHKVFTQSVIWDINPFDQWGVELGKTLANDLLPALSGAATAGRHDSASKGLIAYYRQHEREQDE